ncbi:MAG: glycosyltransferase [Luteitalea sp.]|nr:glycosyltransferase [Luteitalea sp.]
MRTQAIILLDLLPVSVYYRRYFHSRHGCTALQHCVCAVAALTRDVTVVTFDDTDHRRAHTLLSGHPCRVHRSHECLELHAIVEAVGEEDKNILVYRLECLLTPHELIRRALSSHVERGHGMTWAEGLPTTGTPVLFRREFISRFVALGLPDVGKTCEAVLDIVRRTGVANVSTAVGLAAVGIPVETLYGPCPISAVDIAVAYPRDVDRLLTVLERHQGSDGEEGSWARLNTWQVLAVKQREAELARLTQAANVPPVGPGRRVHRVLYVSHASGYSGAEESLLQLIRHLPQHAFEKCALVALEGQLTSRLRQADVEVVCPEREFLRPTLENLLYAASVLRDLRPNIVHLNGLDGLPVLAAVKALRIPTVLHVRNGVFGAYEEYASAADRIIAVSEFAKRGVLSMVSDVAHITVIYDEVDPDTFRPDLYGAAEARCGFGLPETAFVVGMVARFANIKRHDIMIRAIAEARTRIPDIRLLLIGENFEHPEVFASTRAKIAEHGVEGCVTWVPFVEDIRRVHASLDVLALCSDAEGLGRCVVEAMAMAVPVVVTRSGGTPEIVRHGVNGLVVRPDDPHALAEALVDVAAQPNKAVRLGRSGRDFVLAHLTAAASAEAVAGIYDDLMKSPV